MENDDGYARAVIDTVNDMARRLEDHSHAGDMAREQLRETVEGTVAAMRADVHKAIVSLQLGQVDHKVAHEADRVERVVRQQSINIWMAALAILGLINIGVSIALVFGR